VNDEEKLPDETRTEIIVKPRPVLLSVLCIFSFVYFGLLSVLFLAGLYNASAIASVTGIYTPGEMFSKSEIRLLFTGGMLLHLIGFAGVVLLWRLRKTGYYILGLSCIIIASFQTFRPDISVTTTAIYVLMIFLFGVFYKRYR
jgi:hypothetical protein